VVELLLLRVHRLEQVAQEHRYCGDVLAGPRKLQGVIGICDNGLLDLTGVCPYAARSVTSIRPLHRHEWQLVLPVLA
jgi:hypothetical protein